MSKLKKLLSIFTKKDSLEIKTVISLETSIPEDSNSEMKIKEPQVEWHENTTEF